MSESPEHQLVRPEEVEGLGIEWNLENIAEIYTGRRVQVYHLSVSETNTYAPYLKRALYLLEEVSVTKGDLPTAITFKLKNIESDVVLSDNPVQYRSITRNDPPEKVSRRNFSEIWDFGDEFKDDAQTMTFIS